MRWLWMFLFLGVVSNGCNSSNGSNCASAGGVCVLASCSPYCLNGTCFTPLAESAQDCPNSVTNSAGQTNTGNPCCLTQESTDSGEPEASTSDAAEAPDAAQPSDATTSGDADATVAIDSSVPADASREEGGSDAEASAPICSAIPDGGDGGGICSAEGGGD
jgi:hypothetical protein